VEHFYTLPEPGIESRTISWHLYFMTSAGRERERERERARERAGENGSEEMNMGLLLGLLIHFDTYIYVPRLHTPLLSVYNYVFFVMDVYVRN
jgi:hypothetical protein